MTKSKKWTTKDVVYVAVFAALALVFKFVGGFIPFLKMANGGSIEIEMIVLVIASFVLGYQKGIVSALVYWVLAFMFNEASYFLNPLQYACDYLIPFVAMGCTTLFLFKGIKNDNLRYIVAVFIAFFIKYICHLISGAFFYFPEGEVAGSVGAWIYSIGYNAPYVIVSMIIAMLIVPMIMSRVKTKVN